ncbi:MAG: flagellar basal body rod C-terminal domain-containing protein [Gaiellales bacterium]
MQGYLEGSNASPVDDAAVRIESPHGYDALGQVIRTADDMQRSLLDLRG